jgi:hypothetical protein
MAKKQFFLIIDTETTINSNVADFGAVVCDRQGNIFEHCAVLVNDFKNEELFHDPKIVDNSLWAKNNLQNRRLNYEKMLNDGQRTLASVSAINRFLERVIAKYPQITLTAYNLAFDVEKCEKSGINLNAFTNRVCLWRLFVGAFAKTKAYKNFVLQHHYFGNVTAKTKSLTYKTNAECASHFLTGVDAIEPHTAFEDIVKHEIFILSSVLKKKNWRDLEVAYNYRDFQLKDNFNPN